MASSSRQAALFGINDWTTIYQTYQAADFQSYDYETLRKTFVDYLRTNYPETFNDYIESSEYIALLDVMAFMGQALSFRNDLNARENFIDTAQRRDSVIKLANLVGYIPKRNLNAQGLLKISSIQTTESLIDVNGINLSNIPILWNDPANSNWQQQFNSVINASLINTQKIGRPGNSQNLLGINTSEYSVNIPATNTPTIPFVAQVDGQTMNFECVSVTSLNQNYLYELPPTPNGTFNILYQNDSLGYGSKNTGFFVYFKEGSLNSFNFILNNQVDNQVVDINVQGINNTDTWLYQLNTNTGLSLPWKQVESVYSVYNPTTGSSNAQIFSVISRFNDQVSYAFGDGVFGQIPVGNFTAYYRAGNASTYSIDPAELQGTTVTLNYVSRVGRTETLTITLELNENITNAQARETLQDIKTRAPQNFYTQNRMVNGEDYNTFPYTKYNSIIKSKALNRSSIGVSRNFDLIDPTAKYSSTNDFSDDGGLYLDNSDGFESFIASSVNDSIAFISNKLTAILTGNRVFQYYVETFARFEVNSNSGDGQVNWNQSSFNSIESTGYFYSNNVASTVPIGIYSTGNVRFVTAGAMLKFNSPAGYYFDSNNNLIAGFASPSDPTYLWTSVSSVVGDGTNSGTGNLNTGYGPVTLTNSIPQGVILVEIIPSFTNSLSSTIVSTCVSNISLKQNFSLVFDNTLPANQERWSISTSTDANALIIFTSSSTQGAYDITYKSIAYYFGSANNVRFTFDKDAIIYDPSTGLLMQDFVKVLAINSQLQTKYPLYYDFTLTVVGQSIEPDGYVDDYSVEISPIDPHIPGLVKNPDFFKIITGYEHGEINLIHYVFFQQLTDSNMLTRYIMIPSSKVIYAWPALSLILPVRYQYPVGQLFYAAFEKAFYQSVADTTTVNVVDIVKVEGYSALFGRQGLNFQYRHNSSDTNRVNPATTNIVDLYLVTQGYYTNYQNWIQDTTNTVIEPNVPTVNELKQSYSELNNYKMLTDSVIMNSVQFKPLFGNKAESNLQATIKVVPGANTTASSGEIASGVLTAINTYFNIQNWGFGNTFYFSELSAYLHTKLGDLIGSVILVPKNPNLTFGDLYQIGCAPYEIFVNAAQVTDIVIISALTPAELQT